jgi:hypothetical protein
MAEPKEDEKKKKKKDNEPDDVDKLTNQYGKKYDASLANIPSELAKLPGIVGRESGLFGLVDKTWQGTKNLAGEVVDKAGGQIAAQNASPTYKIPPDDLFAREERRANAQSGPTIGFAKERPAVVMMGKTPVAGFGAGDIRKTAEPPVASSDALPAGTPVVPLANYLKGMSPSLSSMSTGAGPLLSKTPPVAATPVAATPVTDEEKMIAEGQQIKNNLLKQGYGIVGVTPGDPNMPAYGPNAISPAESIPTMGKNWTTMDASGKVLRHSSAVGIPQLYPGGIDKYNQDLRLSTMETERKADRERTLGEREEMMTSIRQVFNKINNMTAEKADLGPLKAAYDSVVSDRRSYTRDRAGNEVLSPAAASLAGNIANAIAHVAGLNTGAGATALRDVSQGLTNVAGTFQNVMANDQTTAVNRDTRIAQVEGNIQTAKIAAQTRGDIAREAALNRQQALLETQRIHNAQIENWTRDDRRRYEESQDGFIKSLGTTYDLDGKAVVRPDLALYTLWSQGYPESVLGDKWKPVLLNVKNMFFRYVQTKAGKPVAQLNAAEQAALKDSFEAELRAGKL